MPIIKGIGILSAPNSLPTGPCQIRTNPQTVIASTHLFKLRTAVARHGERDLADWWPTQGLLAPQGGTLFQRSFPRTHPFARARVAQEAARARAEELYPVRDALTIWALPAELEEQLELERQHWLKDAEAWAPFFKAVEAHSGGELLDFLTSLGLVRDTVIEEAKRLTPPVNGPAVALPSGPLTEEAIELLAAAHALGRQGSPVVPHLGTRAA